MTKRHLIAIGSVCLLIAAGCSVHLPGSSPSGRSPVVITVDDPESDPDSNAVDAETVTDLPAPTDPEIRPTNATDPVVTSISDSLSACDSASWIVVPTAVYTQSWTDGYKVLLVTLAVQNNSAHWGRIVSDPIPSSFVVSEDGYSYPAEQQFPIDRGIPYLGNTEGTMTVSSRLQVSQTLPPGFAFRGWEPFGMGVLSDDIIYAPGSWSQAVYRVAESQTHFYLVVPSMTIECWIPGEQRPIREVTVGQTIDLDNEVHELSFFGDHTDRAAAAPLGEPIEIPGVGRLTLNEIGFEPGTAEMRFLVLRFEFQNASDGYETSGQFRADLWGSDGIVRTMARIYGPEGCNVLDGALHAGPGQTEYVQICYHVGAQDLRYHLVWNDERLSQFKVFAIPENP